MQSKPWVRGKLQVPAGEPLPAGFEPPEAWFSVRNKIGRRRLHEGRAVCRLCPAGDRRVDPKENVISITSIGDNRERGFRTSRGVAASRLRRTPDIKLGETSIELVERAQRDVSEGDRRWIEFTFKLRDSRWTPNGFIATLHSRSPSRLPIDMVSTEKFSPEDKAVRTYVFDYPLRDRPTSTTWECRERSSRRSPSAQTEWREGHQGASCGVREGPPEVDAPLHGGGPRIR